MAIIGLRKPPEQSVRPEPGIGDAFPRADDFPSERAFRCIAFLRHTGCPFAEQTVKELRDLASQDRRVDVFLVGHGEAATGETWLGEIGGAGSAAWRNDASRDLYGQCGLGYSGASHFLGRESLGAALALRARGVRNRRASGTRWQKAGTFVLDRNGKVVWKLVPRTANVVPSAAEIAKVLRGLEV